MKDHKKNNARTFRYSDEVAAILQQHNNDFDALVLECFYKLPEVRKEIELQEQKIKELRNEWYQIYNSIRNLRNIKNQIDRIETNLKSISINM